MIVPAWWFTTRAKIWAQDGSLKINVDVPVQADVNEQTYFRQDITLRNNCLMLFVSNDFQNNRQKSHYLKRKIRLFFLSTDSQKLNRLKRISLLIAVSLLLIREWLRPEEKTSPLTVEGWIHCIRIINGRDIDLSILKKGKHIMHNMYINLTLDLRKLHMDNMIYESSSRQLAWIITYCRTSLSIRDDWIFVGLVSVYMIKE